MFIAIEKTVFTLQMRVRTAVEMHTTADEPDMFEQAEAQRQQQVLASFSI